MIDIDFSSLQNKKNLLAFSAGIDSSALFFLLRKQAVSFNIAIVDYGIRAQSKEEVAHAKALAERYNILCHTTNAPDYPTHFEANARAFRYRFFKELIQEHGYDTLLTAHQLNDQLEWLLMRLTKGAGISELLGLKPITQREGYTLIRPLLSYSKEELLAYLQENDHPYFTDESNQDKKYERNRFRKQFSDPLIKQHKEGIKRSLRYLRADAEHLQEQHEIVYSQKLLRIIKLSNLQAKSRAADLTLKELGYLLSAPQRQEIVKEKSLVIGGKWAVEQQDDLLYIAPFLTMDMPKRFKEKCRVSKIPAKIRPYLFVEDISLP